MHLSPVKAIKRHCLDCSGGSKKDVRECIILNCPLYPFRMGKNPNRKGLRLKTSPSQENSISTVEKKQIERVEHKPFFETSLFEK